MCDVSKMEFMILSTNFTFPYDQSFLYTCVCGSFSLWGLLIHKVLKHMLPMYLKRCMQIFLLFYVKYMKPDNRSIYFSHADFFLLCTFDFQYLKSYSKFKTYWTHIYVCIHAHSHTHSIKLKQINDMSVHFILLSLHYVDMIILLCYLLFLTWDGAEEGRVCFTELKTCNFYSIKQWLHDLYPQK